MPTKRLSMRRIHRLMTLHFGAGAATRAISRELSISHSTVREYLARIAAAGITWPLPAELTDQELERRLFVNGGVRAGARHYVEPDWAAVARELKRPGVNLMVLWEEYRSVHADGYAYSRYCQLFREFERRLSPSMRQSHVAGDKAFVDFSGKRIPITDPATGVVREAEIFVGVLVPDNLKSGVHKASFYDPEVNRSYGAMAAHYGVGILPARPYHPKDKAKVEAGVRIAQFYLLGRLRNLKFFSLAECNAAISGILVQLNGRVMRRLGISRRELFETVERPAMRPLPDTDHEYAEWAFARVGIDYHVAAAGFFYSVPHTLIRQQVETRLTERTVEVFHRGQRVAAHARRYGGPRHGTLPDHMPSAHRLYAEWSPERFQSQARAIGPSTEALIIAVLARRPHPEQGFRTCLGILRLYRGIDGVRAEAISARAVEIGALNYQSVASILEHRLEIKTATRTADSAPILHANIRGSRYYH
jgi:transposase